MGKNYYNILNVPRNVDKEALKKAYHLSCKKWHPDKNNNNKIAEEKFKEISEAYDVLNDPEKRKIYDQYGEEGLKGGNGPGGTSYTYNFNAKNQEDVLKELFGGNNPFSQFYGNNSEYSNPQYFSFQSNNNFYSPKFREGQIKAKDIIRELQVSLNDLFNGKTKRVKITRNTNQGLKEEIVNINIKPGWKDGTRIIFNNKGDELNNIIPADIIFIIKEKAHPLFTRECNNLVFQKSITLEEALCGTKVDVMTLDNRFLRININDIVHPTYFKIISNEGMPITNNLPNRGDLKIKFNILWPQQLNNKQKDLIHSVFS